MTDANKLREKLLEAFASHDAEWTKVLADEFAKLAARIEELETRLGEAEGERCPVCKGQGSLTTGDGDKLPCGACCGTGAAPQPRAEGDWGGHGTGAAPQPKCRVCLDKLVPWHFPCPACGAIDGAAPQTQGELIKCDYGDECPGHASPDERPCGWEPPERSRALEKARLYAVEKGYSLVVPNEMAVPDGRIARQGDVLTMRAGVFLVNGVPPTRHIPDLAIDGAVGILREQMNDGADGESAHLVCDAIAQLRRDLARAEEERDLARHELLEKTARVAGLLESDRFLREKLADKVCGPSKP